MNDEHLKQQITVMQHYLNGGEVEFVRIGSNSDWAIAKNPGWNWYHYQYRIKPAKPITIEPEDIPLLYKLIRTCSYPFSREENAVLHKIIEKCKQSLLSYSS